MAVWGKRRDIEKRITGAMQEVFSTKEDRKMAIHVAAATGAGIVAVLPVGIDAWALRIAEIVMVICIAASYGEKLTKSAAKGLFLSSFAQFVGEKAAFAALEALEVGKVASAPTGVGPVAAYAAKAGIAVGLIETVGKLVMAYYEKPDSLAGKACKTAEIIGVSADIGRAIEALTSFVLNGSSSTIDLPEVEQSGTGDISFKGSLTDSERRDAVRKLDSAKSKLRDAKRAAEHAKDSKLASDLGNALQKVDYLQSDVILDRSTLQTTLNDANRALKKIPKNVLG